MLNKFYAKWFDCLWKQLIWVALLLFFCSLVYTYPLVLRIDTDIAGYGNDLSKFYWNHWWFKYAVEHGQNPWQTTMLWYPNGGSLAFGTNRFVSAALGWTVTPVLGSISAYNIVFLLSFVASGLGIFLLVRYLTGRGLASFAAAIVFTFNPFKFNQLLVHHNIVSTCTFGFVFWLFLKLLKEENHRTRNAVILAVLVAVTIYESTFLSVLLAAAMIFILLWYAIADRKLFWQWSRIKALLFSAGLSLLFIIPYMIIVSAALPEYGSGLPRAGGDEKYSNDLLNIFMPSPIPFSPFGAEPQQIFTEKNHVYSTPEENFGTIGWIVLPLSLAGWWLGRKKSRLATLSLIAALFFLLLSLGPYLSVGGTREFQVVSEQSFKVPMPFLLFSHLPPLFGMVRTPSRLILLTFLFLSILVGFTLSGLQDRFKKAGPFIALGILFLIAVDYFPHGIITRNMSTVPIPVSALAKIDGSFGVVNVGIPYYDFMKYGTAHRKPQTSGYIARVTPNSRAIQVALPLYIRRLAIFALENPESPRIEKQTTTLKTLLYEWRIGAILHQGVDQRQRKLAELLGGRIEAKEGDLALILMPKFRIHTDGKIDITPETWPRMPEGNFDSGSLSKIFRATIHGFDLCIPDSLMKQGEISIIASNALQAIPIKKLTMYLKVNNKIVATLDPEHDYKEFKVTLPSSFDRKPVNVISFRFGLEERSGEDKNYPFSLNALSSNVDTGNFSYLSLNGRERLPLEHRSASIIHLAFDEKGKSLETLTVVDPRTEIVANVLRTIKSEFDSHRWRMILTVGNIGPEASQDLAEFIGPDMDPSLLRGRSFITLIDSKTKKSITLSNKDAIAHLSINERSLPVGPVLNIKSIHFK